MTPEEARMRVTFDELVRMVGEASRNSHPGLIPEPVACEARVHSLDEVKAWTGWDGEVGEATVLTVFHIPVSVDESVPVGMIEVRR